LVKSQLGNDIQTIIEFGSYDGGDGIKYKYNFPTANVYSIEPSLTCYTKIKQLEVYGLNVYNYAISNTDSVCDFYETYDSQNNNYAPCGSLNKEFVSTDTGRTPLQIKEPIKVATKKLKTFCNDEKISKIDLLHIDVEGHCREVIEGMEDLKPRMIYLEVRSDTHNHSGDIASLLVNKNFRKLGSMGSDEVWVPN
jgi:FkbM family methyltransferase